MITPTPIWVGKYIDIPYVEGRADFQGADCWGLLELVYQYTVQKPLPPYPGPRTWRGSGKSIAEAAEAYAKLFVPVLPGQEREFDGVLINTGGRPAHIGICTRPGWMLHIEEGSNATHERYRPSMLWAKRIAGFYRYVG